MKRLLCLMTFLIWAPLAQALTIGDDGLHKPDWLEQTFLDLSEDLAEANAQGKRLMVLIEQRGCIYCTRMHEEVFTDPEVEAYIREHFFVLQLNMFGDLEVVDFDGTIATEKNIVRQWGLLFTPTVLIFPSEVGEGMRAHEASVATMPGAFGRHTTLNLLTWAREEVYLGEESFQQYHARILREKGITE